MSDQNRSSTSIPFLPILMVLSTLVGAYLWTQKPLISSRPDLNVNLDRKVVDNEVQARLWEDPFHTVHQSEEFKKYKKQCITKLDSNNEGDSNNYGDKKCREFENPATIIKDLDLKYYNPEKDSSTYDLTVLLVMMDGGIYSENYESRLRTRYSVVSGLGFAGYFPTNSDKINFINYRYPISEKNGANLDDCERKAKGNSNQDSIERTNIILPYEIYERPNREYVISDNEENLSFNREKLSKRVVVLWAEDEKFRSDFVLKNNALIKIVKHAYSCKLEKLYKNNLSDRFKDKKIQFDYRIIGPRNSTTLSRIFEETLQLSGLAVGRYSWSYTIDIDSKIMRTVSDNNQKDYIKTSIELISPWSTMPDEILFWEYNERHPSLDWAQRVSAFKELNILNRGFDKIKYHYERTNKSDIDLAKELIEELCERRAIGNSSCDRKVPDTKKINKKSEKRSKIVLISEWDTIYGRSLPFTFKIALCIRQGISDKDEKEICNIEDVLTYSYLRGIDGKTGNNEQILSNEQDKAPRNSNKEKGDETQFQNELPVGTSQLDYLRRLSQHLKHIDTELRAKCSIWDKVQGKCGIKAIGVLGSDVYDKLLILHALKEDFPDTWFFTTDLDARLFDAKELKSTKNLIVASGFGLEINSDIIGFTNSPVFRNSYQTALFFSTLRAVGFVDIHYEKDESGNLIEDVFGNSIPRALKFKNNIDEEYDLVETTKPRLFEIGRNGPVNISVETEKLYYKRPSLKIGRHEPVNIPVIIGVDKTEKLYIHPERPSIVSIPSSKIRLLFLILFAAIVLSFIPMNLFIREEKERDFKKVAYSVLFLFCTFLVFAFIIWFIKAILNSGSEPFLILEGMSVWPTELLRIFIIILVLVVMYYINKLTIQSDEHLEEKYFLPDNNERTTDNKDSESDGSKKWSKYFQLNFSWHDQSTEEAEKYWDAYKDRGAFRKRLRRSTIWTIIFLIFGGLLVVTLGIPNRPVRGENLYILDTILLFLSALAQVFVLAFVVDSSKLSQRLIEFISQRSVKFPRSKQVIDIAARKGINENLLNGYVKLRFIEEHTRFISKFLYFPFLVLLIGVIARNKYFDAWNYPTGFIITLFILILYALFSSFNLNSAAKKAKSIVLEDLQDNIEKKQGRRNKKELEQMVLLKDDVINIRGGAYSPILSQPAVQSILLPAGGLGILSIIEFLFRQ